MDSLLIFCFRKRIGANCGEATLFDYGKRNIGVPSASRAR
jgi:hypothetical protein